MSASTSHHQDSQHGTVKSYVIGFGLSIFLTVVPYMLVVNKLLDSMATVLAISLFAIAQLMVQVIFFLHLGAESKPRWNLTAFIFTAFAALVFIFGSLWIMYSLDYNMMMHH